METFISKQFLRANTRSKHEVPDETEENSDNSILITSLPKYTEEKPVNRPFPCQECRKTFINKQFLSAHTRSKHETEHLAVPDETEENTENTAKIY